MNINQDKHEHVTNNNTHAQATKTYIQTNSHDMYDICSEAMKICKSKKSVTEQALDEAPSRLSLSPPCPLKSPRNNLKYINIA